MSTIENKPEGIQGSDFVTELGWLGAGAILPLTSLSFYKRALRRPPMMALIFFLAFGLMVGLLTSIGITRDLVSLDDDVRQALVESEFPTITIEDGVARADVPQPYTLYEDDQIAFIIDTTGQITRLDTGQLDQGMLLTATELHMLNPGSDYNITDLGDLNLLFGRDPLIVNADTISTLAGGLASVFSVVVFVALLVWHIFVRLAWVSFIALIVWALAGTFWQGVKYAEIWVVGAYSAIPALYITYLLSSMDLSICGVQSFLLVMIMLAVVYAVRPQAEVVEAHPDQPSNLQFAWIGLPLLLVLAYDLLFALPYQRIILWGVMLATATTLAVLEYVVKPEGIAQG